MTFTQCQQARFSVRRYSPQPVDPALLQEVLQAGRRSPTACNKQPQRVLVLQSKEATDKAAKAANIHGGPCVLVVCADRTQAWVRPYDGMNSAVIDATIVTDQMMMAATERGFRRCGFAILTPIFCGKSWKSPTNGCPSIYWCWAMPPKACRPTPTGLKTTGCRSVTPAFSGKKRR